MASSSTPNLKAYGRKFLCKHQVQERWFCNTRYFPSAHNFNYTVTKAFLCLLHGAPLLQFWWLQWHHRCLVKWLSRCKFGFIWLSKLRKQRKCSSKVHTLLPQSIYPLLWLPQKHLSIIAASSAQNPVWMTTEQPKRKQRFAERKPLAVGTTKWARKRVFCLQVHSLTHWPFTLRDSTKSIDWLSTTPIYMGCILSLFRPHSVTLQKPFKRFRDIAKNENTAGLICLSPKNQSSAPNCPDSQGLTKHASVPVTTAALSVLPPLWRDRGLKLGSFAHVCSHWSPLGGHRNKQPSMA